MTYSTVDTVFQPLEALHYLNPHAQSRIFLCRLLLRPLLTLPRYMSRNIPAPAEK